MTMIKSVSSVKEVLVEVPNKVGNLAKLTESLAGKKINIVAMTAFTQEDKAWIQVVTSDYAATVEAVVALGWKAVERDAVRLVLKDTVGAAHSVSALLAEGSINVESIYGSSVQGGVEPTLIVVPADVTKATELLKTIQ